LDHRAPEELVKISVQILLTPSYGAILCVPTGSRADSPRGYRLRSYDFWKDFQVQVFEGDEERFPLRFTGEPNSFCSHTGCTLTGATLDLEFPAPEVSVDFDLAALR